MESELDLICANAPKWLEPTADMAQAIVEQYRAGGVDELELQDILVRLCDSLDSVPGAAQDLDTKSAFITALYAEAGLI